MSVDELFVCICVYRICAFV